TDQNSGFRPIEGDESVVFRHRGDPCDVYRLEETIRMVPGEFLVRDYNYRTPQVALNGVSTVPGGVGAVVEYGAHVKTPEEAQQLAETRAQERLTFRRVFDGASDIPRLRAGAKVMLEEHPYGNLHLLLVEVSHSASMSALGQGSTEGLTYSNELKAIPYSRRYRPPRITPKPKVHGVLTGVVEGPKGGDYAELDAEGRYRVRFLFDTSTPEEQQASRPVRMAQPHAGAGYGMHFPLRQGVEVILTFVDGDPDRPIIASTVPNPLTSSPVTASNAPRNVIRTGGGNEINIDDSRDNQRIKLSTPHKSTTFQLGYRNSPEDGAILETQGANSTIAMSGAAMYTSASAAVSSLKDFFLSGQITTVAEFTPFMTGVTTVKALMGQALDLAGAYLDMEDAKKKKKEAELKQKAVKDQMKAYEAEKRREAARKRTGEKIKAVEGTITMTPQQQAEVDQLRAEYEAAQKAYDEKLIEYRTTLEWLADAKKGEWVPTAETANAQYVLDSYAQIQTQEKAKADLHKEIYDPGGLKAQHEAARQAYLDKLKALAGPSPSPAQQAAIGEADEAITAEGPADTEADAAWNTAFDSRNAFNTQVGVNELGQEAIEIKEQRGKIAKAKLASVIFSEVMALFAAVMDIKERLKHKDEKADLKQVRDDSKPRLPPDFSNKSTYVPPFGKSLLGVKHTLGSSGDTVLYAEHELLSWAKTALLLGKDGVLIESGEHLSLLSKDKAELAAREKILETSKEIDVLAYEKLVMKAEPGPPHQGGKGTMELESKGLMTLKSQDKNIELAAKTKAGQSIRIEAKTTVFGAAEHVTLNASKVATLLSGSFQLQIDGQAGSATLGSPSWKLSIKDGEVKLGTTQNGLMVQSASTHISYGPSMVKVASSKTQVKAQGMLELEGSIIRANGKCLLG
ncbi:MAG TPA: type VI secretion system tip protein VgrG, partial [Candidatus Nanopelagicales bacterium]|nr:type VI secretion system tip protein VgrG [Candidatus Nanopelagicales bacterium]